MNVALICIALLGLLLFGLGLGVSSLRGKSERVTGSSGDPADSLEKMIRAHGNTAEYAPMLAVLMLVLGSSNPPAWATWCMILATASRYSIAIGLIVGPTMAKPHPLRFVGALGTYGFGIALCVAIFMSL